jgi:choline dehydrogenase-like flavoprotein/alpha-beta hydrolase superfamily lysophospholipase
MRRLSKKVETLTACIEREREARNDPDWVPEYDVVVVGSGYGGAVAACRFAEVGRSVCLLERGSEYLPGEFPNSIANLPGQLRMHRAGSGKLSGKPDGLFDLRLHRGVSVLVGNALGGTSQINANVALRADPAIFRDPRWPRELRETYDPLDAWYTAVEDMLGASAYPESEFSIKAEQLARLAEPLSEHLRRGDWTDGDAAPQARFYRPPLAVNFVRLPNDENRFGVTQKPCVGCGDCVTGCNYEAKSTLTMNYLPRAVACDAQLYCGASVIALEHQLVGGEPAATVYFSYSDVDWSAGFADGINAVKLDLSHRSIFRVKARAVVLAAGTLGSTEILLRSRQLGLLEVSPILGAGFSGNGDALGFGFAQDALINGIGWGADKAHYRDPAMPKLSSPGPSIVGVLDARGGLAPRDGVLIQDGILPGAIAHLTHEMLATTATLARLDRLNVSCPGEDPLALSDEALRRTQTYLFMGHDDSGGIMALEQGRVTVRWPGALAQPVAAREDAYLGLTRKALGAVPLRNPMTHLLPAELEDVLSSPPLEGNALVVHPLGGCAMGDDFDHGVVNHGGALFDGSTPTSVYGSIYVWDGSIVPSSLGANPFLTIAALAERAAARLLDELDHAQERRRPPLCPATRHAHDARPTPAFENPGEAKVAVRLQETLRGSLLLHGGESAWPAALQVKMKIPDLLGLLRDPAHRITRIRGGLNIPALDAKADLAIKGGSVSVLVRNPGFAPWRTLKALCTWWVKRGFEETLRNLRDRIAGKRKSLDAARLVWQSLKLASHAGEVREMRYLLRLRAKDGRAFCIEGLKTLRYACDTNLWKSLTQLQVILREGAGGAELARGVLELDLVDLSERDLPQLVAARDLPNALLALASYPLFFLRAVMQVHLWDFRAPDYPSRTLRTPIESQRPLFVDRIWLPQLETTVEGKRYWLQVPVRARQAAVKLPIALTRFRAPQGNGVAALLLHGFAQSSCAFVAEPLKEDLARHLLLKGYDVWLLDYRTSTALPSGREQCSLDEVAQFDIPEAMLHIKKTMTDEGRQPRIIAIGHCMGAATLAMSLLADWIGTRPDAIVLSQVPPFITGGTYSQFRRQLAAFLRDVVGVKSLNLAADDGANAWETLMDRLFATLPVAADCPHGGDPQVGTCHRVSGIIGPLYLHKNLQKVHPHLDRYFGWASISVFSQIAKFFEYERLVSGEGSNIYVNDDYIKTRLNLPILLLHGRENQVFDKESAQRSYDQLVRVNGEADYELQIIPDYAHFDCIVGDKAHEAVYPLISEFLEKHLTAAAAAPERGVAR